VYPEFIMNKGEIGGSVPFVKESRISTMPQGQRVDEDTQQLYVLRRKRTSPPPSL